MENCLRKFMYTAKLGFSQNNNLIGIVLQCSIVYINIFWDI